MSLAQSRQAQRRPDDVYVDDGDGLAVLDPPVANASCPVAPDVLGAQQQALLELGRWLQAADYQFTTVTPRTHQEWVRRQGAHGHSLRDVFGWNRPFEASLLPAAVIALLQQAGVLLRRGDYFRSAVRFASLRDLLLVHSAYPTEAANAVFFGPDSYRFSGLIWRTLRARHEPVRTIADIGCGTGVGGLLAARQLASSQPRLLLTDISPLALSYSAVNAHLAGQPAARCQVSDLLDGLDESPDLILCNPPYLVDEAERLYRHGGGPLGCNLAVGVVAESLAALAPDGQLILYTGAPIVEGKDMLWAALQPLLGRGDIDCEYEEIDPDVFGEELRGEAYRDVDRIAAVGLVVRKH